VKFLVDTHAFLWAVQSPERLTDRVRNVFTDREAELLLSIATPWEMAIKAGIGRLENGAEILDDFENRVTASGYRILETSIEHTIRSAHLPRYHKDPFDRLLIAQALDLNIPILSRDNIFDLYGVRRVWK
jgi:PIN domain nuclease of toxin-antitoxin system